MRTNSSFIFAKTTLVVDVAMENRNSIEIKNGTVLCGGDPAVEATSHMNITMDLTTYRLLDFSKKNWTRDEFWIVGAEKLWTIEREIIFDEIC